MTDGAPLYRPAVDSLPAVYQEDAASFEQVSGYLALADELLRGYLAALEDLPAWLSPEARGVRPPGPTAGLPAGLSPQQEADRQLAAVEGVFAELAGWFAFKLPASWRKPDPEATLDRHRDFLLRGARLWRERGTPRGFIAWFCFYFELSEVDEVPILLEHFKYRDDHALGAEGDTRDDAYAHRVSLLVPLKAFDAYERRREAVQFVARYAPAHLLVRVCWTAEGFTPPPLDDEAKVRELLGTITSFVEADDGIHLGKCPLDEAGPRDRLGQGQLPGGGQQ